MNEVEFTIIRNPSNLLRKYEVWMKGEAITVDRLGQVTERLQFNRNEVDFFTLKGAQGFVTYQQERRKFVGAV